MPADPTNGFLPTATVTVNDDTQAYNRLADQVFAELGQFMPNALFRLIRPVTVVTFSYADNTTARLSRVRYGLNAKYQPEDPKSHHGKLKTVKLHLLVDTHFQKDQRWSELKCLVSYDDQVIDLTDSQYYPEPADHAANRSAESYEQFDTRHQLLRQLLISQLQLWLHEWLISDAGADS